jgi:hypothetical protein
VVADGSLIVTGVAAGTSAVSLCGELATCATAELASRETAGHTNLRKNQAQLNAQQQPVYDSIPVKGVRFRKPDVSSVRPDGIRHNTNYVSNRET